MEMFDKIIVKMMLDISIILLNKIINKGEILWVKKLIE